MRRFSADYLERTREGMWSDGRDALADLDLSQRARVLDIGCGTGEFTRVLAAETPPDSLVIGVDADTELLEVAADSTGLPMCAGDATRLPFSDDSVDLVVCQALLINVPDPLDAVREFARVSTDLVAAVEPNNAEVTVSSTVDAEERLEGVARRAFLDGIDTDVALGGRIRDLFAGAGIETVSARRYVHTKRIAAPYDTVSLESAARKASGAGLADHREELRSTMSQAGYDDLRRRWRAMGRVVIEEMRAGEYERIERVPFDVTVGRVGATSR